MAYQMGVYDYKGGASAYSGGVKSAGNENTTSSARYSSATKSGVVNLFTKKRSKLQADMDRSSALSKPGAYNPTMGMEAAHQRSNADIARSKWSIPKANRDRRLQSMDSSRHFLDQASGPTAGKSSRDTTQESYSTMETRMGKNLVYDPKSAYQKLGAESVRGNVTQMFRADTKNKGAIRRSQRKFL